VSGVLVAVHGTRSARRAGSVTIAASSTASGAAPWRPLKYFAMLAASRGERRRLGMRAPGQRAFGSRDHAASHSSVHAPPAPARLCARARGGASIPSSWQAWHPYASKRSLPSSADAPATSARGTFGPLPSRARLSLRSKRNDVIAKVSLARAASSVPGGQWLGMRACGFTARGARR